MRWRWLALAAAIAIAGTAAAMHRAGTPPPRPVMPYVQVSDNQSAALLGQLHSTHVDRAALGFIVADGPRCAPRWDGAELVAKRGFASQIAALRGAHIHAALVFGGQGGRELALSCRSPRALAAAYGQALNTYGLHALDLDLEGAGLARSAVARRGAALALLEQRDPQLAVTVTLPVDPTGIPSDALRALRGLLQAGAGVAAVNVMAMDFGDAVAPDPHGRMPVYVERSARAAHYQLTHFPDGLGAWSRLSLTIMIGRNDTPSEIVSLHDARRIAAFSRVHGLGELRYWSFNRDRPCPRPTPTASDSCSGVNQRANAFAIALGR